MLTTTVHEELTDKIIKAIEHGQSPPWRKAASTEFVNSGFPSHPANLKPFKGVDVLLLNMAATESGYHSRFWASVEEWEYLDSQVSGVPTILGDGTPVYNADQTILSVGSVVYRSRRRRTPVAVDFGPAEAVIKASGATIHHRLGGEAAYYYQEDHVIFPMKWQFEQGPGGVVAFWDSLFHEVAGHWTEPRLGWDGSSIVRELRAEIAAPFLTAQLGIPVLCDTKKLTNHRKHLDRWVKAMKNNATLIVNVTADASEAVEYLLSLAKSAITSTPA